MRLSKAELRLIWEADRRRERRRFLLALLCTCALGAFCLCWRYNAYAFSDPFVPLEYGKSYLLAVRLLFSRLASGPLFLQRQQAIDAIGSITYLGALARLRITAMSFLSGAGIALAGAVFQTAYCNPMASPNILGAGAGVRLGNVLVVMLYSSAAVEHLYLRYEYCYGLTAVCVLLVLLLGRLAGQRQENYSVLEMVMMGSVVSQALNVVVMYIMYDLPDEDLLLLQEIQMGMDVQTDWVSMAVFFGVMGCALLPVLLLRYRLNITGLDKTETASIGLSTGALRVAAQVCGVVMVTCATIHCGDAGMISMVVPYIVRQAVGADFRKVAVYSVLFGGALLMLCRLATSFLVILSEPVPVTFLINLALTPVFLVILARHRRQDT